MNAYTALATRIEVAHDSLTHRPQDMYLLRWAGEWLITTNPSHNARHFGRFTSAVDPRHFAECVYEAMKEARPG